MNVQLLYRDRDVNKAAAPVWNEKELLADLQLLPLLEAMAAGDEFVLSVCQRILLTSVPSDIDTILYRQAALQDCWNNRGLVEQLYALAVEGLAIRRQHLFGIFSDYPSAILSGSAQMLELYAVHLKKLRNFAAVYQHLFMSKGFTRLFQMLEKELDEAYLEEITAELKCLHLRGGLLASAMIGPGMKSAYFRLHRYGGKSIPWYWCLFGMKPDYYTFRVHPRDESGIRALSQLRDRVIDGAASDLAQSCDHIVTFFENLRYELAFYLGGVNLRTVLDKLGMPVCFGEPALEMGQMEYHALYDPCLALEQQRRVVASDVSASGRKPVMITGANQGGKSTFLRSLGVAQLMLQAGLFVPASAARASLCASLLTHFKREEDRELKSGKLDEELHRMSIIVSKLTRGSMVLFNESFASTNEKEGAEIGRQIIKALTEHAVQVFFVTHLYELARAVEQGWKQDALFLQAERLADQSRSFRIIEAAPLRTSYAMDLYDKIFDHVKTE